VERHTPILRATDSHGWHAHSGDVPKRRLPEAALASHLHHPAASVDMSILLHMKLQVVCDHSIPLTSVPSSREACSDGQEKTGANA